MATRIVAPGGAERSHPIAQEFAARPPLAEGEGVRRGEPGPHVAGYAYQNWCTVSAPPVVVNPDASLHALIAWCWGEAVQIDSLVSALSGSNGEGMDVADVTSFLLPRTTGLREVLEVLGARTANAET